jgi:hypothetical protein
MAADDPVAAALGRNDRYLHDFIEALTICPYARGCREAGRLYREVLLLREADAEAVAARIAALEREVAADMEVGLLILPQLVVDAPTFERFVSQVQRLYKAQPRPQDRHGRPGAPAFFVVAFHPELTMKLDNPDIAVRFMRRSPDPTIQLVRPEAIDRVRGERDPESVSRSIAESGLRAVLAVGADKLAQLLAAQRATDR